MSEPGSRVIQSVVQNISQSVTSARQDHEAIALWVAAKGSRSDHTNIAYRREGKRLLVWMSEEGLMLNTMRVEDVHRYFQHLADPPPHWLRPRKPKSDESILETQLLNAPLSMASIAYTRTVLGQLFTYLQDVGYVAKNVFRLSTVLPVIREDSPSRFLDIQAWRFLWQWLINQPTERLMDQRHGIRMRWIFALLYHTGLRIDEAVHATMGDLMTNNGLWYLSVVRKGRQRKRVTINSLLLEEMKRYRLYFGLSDVPGIGEARPLIMPISLTRSDRPLSARFVRKLISQTAREAARASDDPAIQAVLERLSPHWLRHTNATHRLQAGASLETIQEELGHADPKTTRIYAKATDQQRWADAEKLAALARSG